MSYPDTSAGMNIGLVDAARAANFDICKCGDYRRDHLHGSGACTFNGGSHPVHHCTAFDLDTEADPADVERQIKILEHIGNSRAESETAE